MSKIYSPLKYHGGKYYLAPKFRPYLPKHKHRVYLFAGGLSELFAWPYDGVSEVINDIDGRLTEFWQVLQCESWFQAFRRTIEAVPFSEVEFDGSNLRQKLPGIVQRAVGYFIQCRQSRQGLFKDFATLSKNRTRRGMNEQASAWLTSIEGLPEVHNRLKRIAMIYNESFETIIKQEDSPNTFFYADPAYLKETRVSTDDYAFEMSDTQHEQLLEAFGKIKGKFMLSGYPSEMYAEARKKYGWTYRDFVIDNKASSKKEKGNKVERIWMNY